MQSQLRASARRDASSETIPQGVALRCQLAAIVGGEPSSSYVEVRPLHRDGRPALRVRQFVPVGEATRRVPQLVAQLAPTMNVYLGAAPRIRRDGSAASVERVWCLWADLDGPDALSHLHDFHPRPSIEAETSPGRGLAMWALREAATPAFAQRGNRRLALALGADMAATDPARILRPIGSANHKHSPPHRVTCTNIELHTFTLDQVVGRLPDTDHYRPRRVLTQPVAGDPSKVLAGLARTVRDSPEGNRNRALHWSVCRVVEHIAEGEFAEDQAIEELRAAGLDAGLTEHEVEATIRSGLARHARAA